MGEWGSVREECLLCLWENEKEKVERTTKLTGQDSESVRWFSCGGKHMGWVGHVGSQKSDHPPPPLNKWLRCYKISLRHSRTLGTRLYHRLPHCMILPNYINISLGHSRTLDTWPHHRLPHGMILTF